MDQGLEAVKLWLRPLLLPYVLDSYSTVRKEYGLPLSDGNVLAKTATTLAQLSANIPMEAQRSMWASPPLAQYTGTSVGHLALFNQCLQQDSKSIEWVYSDSTGEGSKMTPVWVSNLCLDFWIRFDATSLGRSSHAGWEVCRSWAREHEESCQK